MLVSYVAGEGVEFTVNKESVVAEEIKEVVELRSRRAQLFMTEIIIELGYSHAVMHLADLNKESVVAEEIKEVVELRSRRAQLFMTEIIIELGYSHAVMHLADFR